MAMICIDPTYASPDETIENKDDYDTDLLIVWSAENGNLDDFLISLARKSNFGSADVRDKWGRTPLIAAAAYGQKNIVEHLIKSGVDLHAKDNDGDTALDVAIFYGQSGVSSILEKAGARKTADLSAKEQIMRNYYMNNAFPAYMNDPDALVSAAVCGDFYVFRLLLDRGMDIDSKDDRGRTALMAVAEHGYNPDGVGYILRLLLNRGADPNVRDNDGDTVLDLARYYEHTYLVKLLEERGAIDSIGPCQKERQMNDYYDALNSIPYTDDRMYIFEISRVTSRVPSGQ